MDSLWLGVWWPWALVWAVTVIGLGLAAWPLVAHWRARTVSGQPARGMCFYLQNESVMDLYLAGQYKTALRQEVKEEISSSRNATLNAALHGIGANAGQAVDRKIFREYIETAEPIVVIRIIMEVLEKADGILSVDLLDGTVEPGRSLTRAMRSIALREATRLTFGELRDFEVYVSVRGRFREVAKTGDTISFEAPCVVPGGSGPAAAVLTCAREGIRRQVPTGTFQARCLGKIQDWDPDTRRLVIDPVAIFQ